MEGNYNDHTSATELGRRNYLFADQSDTKTVYVYPTQSSRSKIKDKLEDGFEKSKAVASTGLKKIKRGSTVGFHWIKHKFPPHHTDSGNLHYFIENPKINRSKMEGNYNDHTSATDLGRRNYLFADQSDTKTVYVYPTQSSRSTIKDKLEDGFEKSKAVASTGLKKIKRGSTVGFHWIKHKYQKTTHKYS
ncbi:hypothetical protein L1887_35179 [Cichorium endivia]|nr:hypothetical protein L1887_35179 [Cichorium endivia]